MSNIVPQPQITFENNKIYVDSPVDVKYTLDGLDPVFYGVIYTSPISISHTTTIKAISVNSLGEFSNLVAGTFTPESDVSDGSSGSTWNPSYDDAVTLEELSAMSYATTTYVADYVAEHSGGDIDLSSYVSKDELSAQSYITINDVPETDLSDYVTYDFLSSQSYLTSIPSEYITQQELSSNSYLTSIPSEYITQTELSACGYITMSDVDMSGYLPLSGGTITGDLTVQKNIIASSDIYAARQKESGPSYLWIGANRPWKIWENNQEPTVTANVGNKILRFSGYNTTTGTLYRVFSINENSTTADSIIYAHSPITHENVTYHKGITYNLNTVFTYNVLPYEDTTYTLGDISHMYAATYTAKIGASNNGLWIDNGGAHKYFAGGAAFRPYSNNAFTLGIDTIRWNTTYSYIYKLGYNTSISSDSDYGIQTTINGHKNFQWNLYQFSMIDNNYRDLCSLGTSGTPFAYTYTSYLILNGTDINEKFIPTEGGTVTGRLESNYYTTVNYEGGISSYSSVLVGSDDRNSVTMLATRRLCGETSYAAAFFTNSDGRSKFTHKTKTTATTALGSNDDAFLCFNAYGFKLAYSGTPGTSATTEYEVLHTGNIGNLGYATTTELSSYLSLSGGDMTGNIDFGTSRAYITAKSDGQWKNGWGYAPLKVMSYASGNGSAWTPVFAVKDWGGNVWSAGVVNTREFIFSYQSVGNVGSNNTHTEWKINSSGDLTGAGRTFIHSSNYNNYNTTYTYNLAERLNTLFSFDSSTNTLTITTT